jgi:non-heme chloroperoxidase
MPETSTGLIHWVIDMMLGTSLQAGVECNVGITRADRRRELSRIDRPTLVIHGTADMSAPLDMTCCPTAKLIPRAELKVYEAAPKGVFLTHIERVNQELLTFIRGS